MIPQRTFHKTDKNLSAHLRRKRKKSKVMKKVFFPLATVALLAASTSCSHDRELDMNFDSKIEIRPTAKVIATGISTRAEGDDDETIASTTEDFTGSFAVTAFKQDNDGNETTTHFVNNECTAEYGFDPKQYFPSDNTKLNFYAYSPIASDDDYVSHKASFTLTGTTDVVWANSNGHNKTGAQPNFTFAHKLAKLIIKVQREEASFQSDIELKSITVKNVKNSATLDIKEGTMEYTGSSDLKVNGLDGYKIKELGIYGSIMLPADGNSYTLDIKTKNADNSEMSYNETPVTLNSGTFEGGKEYEVTLTFKGTEIENNEVKITQWTTGGSVSSDVQ